MCSFMCLPRLIICYLKAEINYLFLYNPVALNTFLTKGEIVTEKKCQR